MVKPVLRYQLTFESPGWPSAVTFLDSSRRLVAGNQEGEMYAWDLPETPPELPTEKKPGGKAPDAPNVSPTLRLNGHTNVVSHLHYDAARKLVISSSFDYSIRLWNLDAPATGEATVVLDRLSREEEYKRTKKDEVRQQPGVVVKTQTAAHVLEGHRDWIMSMAASGDGSRLITGDAAAQVIVWDLEKRTPIARWSGHPWNWIVAAALTTDGRGALVSEYRYKRDDFDIPAAALKFWNADDGTEVLDILKVQFPKLDPKETSYGSAQIWNKFTGVGLVAVAISADGKLLATGQGGETDTGKVHILERETGKLLRDVSSHHNGITDVAFSKDGKWLFSAGRDTIVRICQVEDGKELAAIGTSRGGQFKDWISAFAVSPDERWVAAADIAGHISVWELTDVMG